MKNILIKIIIVSCVLIFSIVLSCKYGESAITEDILDGTWDVSTYGGTAGNWTFIMSQDVKTLVGSATNDTVDYLLIGTIDIDEVDIYIGDSTLDSKLETHRIKFSGEIQENTSYINGTWEGDGTFDALGSGVFTCEKRE